MEEQQKVQTEDVEAHIHPKHNLQDEIEPTDEPGKRSLRRSDDKDEDVEAHIKFRH